MSAHAGDTLSARSGQQGGIFLDYVYRVDGTRYEGMSFTTDVTVASSARPGVPIYVFFDPDAPGESVGLLESELDSIRAANI